MLCNTSTSASDAFISPTEVASFLQVGSVMARTSKHARALSQSRLLMKGWVLCVIQGLADKEAQPLPQNTGDIVFVQTLSK